MGAILYIVGVSLAGYAGYSDFQWYFIFISSAIMAAGYFIIRAPQMGAIIGDVGISVIPKLLVMQIIVYSIITAPVYFIAAYFN